MTLKPCPFCGVDPILQPRFPNGIYVVVCLRCGVRTAEWSEAVACESWNRRVQSPPSRTIGQAAYEGHIAGSLEHTNDWHHFPQSWKDVWEATAKAAVEEWKRQVYGEGKP